MANGPRPLRSLLFVPFGAEPDEGCAVPVLPATTRFATRARFAVPVSTVSRMASCRKSSVLRLM